MSAPRLSKDAERQMRLVQKIGEVAAAFGWQAGVGAMELAGQIVSVLYAHPEHIDRFMADGAALFHDGTLNVENGCLTFLAGNGSINSPAELRKAKGAHTQ